MSGRRGFRNGGFDGFGAWVQMHGAAAQGTDCSATRPCANPSQCCSQYNYCDIGDQWCGAGCQNGPCYGTGGGGGGGGSEWSFFTQANFESRFPGRNAIYTYAAFRSAAATYPAFASGAGDVGKREMAAFLANTDHESGGAIPTPCINQTMTTLHPTPSFQLACHW